MRERGRGGEREKETNREKQRRRGGERANQIPEIGDGCGYVWL